MAVDSVCVAITIPDTLSQSEQSSRSGSVRRGSVDLEGSSLSRKRQRLADGEYRDSSQPAEDRVNTSKRPVQQGPSPTIPVPVKKSSHTLRNSPIIRPVLRSDRSLSVASSPGSSTSFQVNEAIIRSIETDAICGSPKIETMRDSGVASKRESSQLQREEDPVLS